jgi:hypothetical protein
MHPIPSLVAFGPPETFPELGWIAVVVAAWVLLRAWDFMAARRWRFIIADCFSVTFCLCLVLALFAAWR